jgi:7-cyano-7-deazaguanine synthase
MSTAILLSGGMDSVAIAFWKRPQLAVTIDYGQRPARAEMRAASAVADALGIKHLQVTIPARELGSGDLAGSPPLSLAPKPEWWPYRNQLLITIAAAKVLPLGANKLLIGTLATDSHHADGSPEFVRILGELLAMQEGGVLLEAPALGMDAVSLIRVSGIPQDILAWSHSCHVADFACGVCGGCRKHYRTMAEIGEFPY